MNHFANLWDLQQHHAEMASKPSEDTILLLEECIQCNVPKLWLKSCFANSKKVRQTTESELVDDGELSNSDDDDKSVADVGENTCITSVKEGSNTQGTTVVVPLITTKGGRCVINREYRSQLERLSLDEVFDSVTTLEEYKRYLDIRLHRKRLSVPYLYSMSSSPAVDHLPVQSQFSNPSLDINGESVATNTVFCKGDRIKYPITYYTTAHSKKTAEDSLDGTVDCSNDGDKFGTYRILSLSRIIED
jgi:hypothetical protein